MRRASVPTLRHGALPARLCAILEARSAEELAGAAAEAARDALCARRAVAVIDAHGHGHASAHSPRCDVAESTAPTYDVELAGHDGQPLGRLRVWARDGVARVWKEDRMLRQIARLVASAAVAPPPAQPTGSLSLLRRVVHDLRTPLSAMLSWTWILKDRFEIPGAARALMALERNARTQARLLDEAAAALRLAGDGAGAGADARSEAANPAPGRSEDTMQRLRDVMTRDVETVAPGDTIRHAAEKMEALDVGSLPVCDGDRLVGILTDRDIAIRAVASGRDPNRTAVVETMTPELVFGYEEQMVDEAADLMREHEIRRLPIVDQANRLVGIVALADLALRADQSAMTDALEGVSKPRSE